MNHATIPLSKPFHIIIKNSSKSLENENYHIYDLSRDVTVQQIRNYLAEKYSTLASQNFKLIYAGRILDQQHLQKKFMEIVKDVHQSTPQNTSNVLEMETYTIHLIMNQSASKPTTPTISKSIPAPISTTSSSTVASSTSATTTLLSNTSNLSQQQLLEQIAQLQTQLSDIRRELAQQQPQQQTAQNNPPQQQPQQQQRENANREPSIWRKIITNFFKFLLLSYLLNGGQTSGNRWLIMAFFFFFIYVIFFSGVLSFLNTPVPPQQQRGRQERNENNNRAEEAEEEEEEDVQNLNEAEQLRYRPQNFFSHILYIIYLFFISLSPSYNPLPLPPIPQQQDEEQQE